MISNPHSRRFDPRFLSTPFETDGEELFEASDADFGSAATQSKNDADLRDFDEALEQIVFEEWRVCPRCGANAHDDGTTVNRQPSDPSIATILKQKDR
jgi:hypothetical protein